jgi:hypothetical protein
VNRLLTWVISGYVCVIVRRRSGRRREMDELNDQGVVCIILCEIM